MAAVIGAVSLDLERVANKEATGALKAVCKPFAYGVAAPRVRLRARVFNVACVAAAWEDIVFVVRIAVFEAVPEPARSPEGMESSVLFINRRHFGVAMGGL